LKASLAPILLLMKGVSTNELNLLEHFDNFEKQTYLEIWKEHAETRNDLAMRILPRTVDAARLAVPFASTII